VSLWKNFYRLIIYVVYHFIKILFSINQCLKTTLIKEEDYVNNCYALLGTNVAIRNAKTLVSKAISSDSSVLIMGEKSTGKSSIAKLIHDQSSTNNHRFVTIECSTVQESNLEKEFTQSQNGTLFFKNIDKLTPRLQFVFTKALQNISISLNKSTSVGQIRLIASSSLDLKSFVSRGFFREDLYSKFSQISIFLLPLRERREDIPLLINYFIQKSNELRSSKITLVSSDALKVLLQHNWPNNLYELDNLIERIAMLKNTGNIELCDLPPRLRSLVTTNIDTFYNGSDSVIPKNNVINNVKPNTTKQNNYEKYSPSEDPEETAIDMFVKKDIDLGNGIDFYRIVEAFENKLLQEALKRAQHNKNKAAQLLSMNRTTLVEKLRKRSIFSHLCAEQSKAKQNASYTVLDGLGTERSKFDNQSYMTISND